MYCYTVYIIIHFSIPKICEHSSSNRLGDACIVHLY